MTPDIGGFIALAALMVGLMVGLIGWLRTDTIRRTDRIEKRLEEQGVALDNRLEEQTAALNERMDRMEKRLDGRMTHMEAVFNERMDRLESGIGDLRERMAHLDGMLDGLREAIVNATRRNAA